MDDVLLNKAGIIERCLRRVAEEYRGDPARLEVFTHQDSVVLNLERACQAAIDMAMYLVARDHLGVPQDSADAFRLLAAAGRLDPALGDRLRRMVGFRNVAIHEYQALDVRILRAIVETRLVDFVDLCSALGLRVSP
jgi:uncharacterized protein YutE (UPF0331/DUF86 family)